MCSSFTTRAQSIKFNFHNVHFRWPLTIKEYNMMKITSAVTQIKCICVFICSYNAKPLTILPNFKYKWNPGGFHLKTNNESLSELNVSEINGCVTPWENQHPSIKDLLPCLGLISFSLHRAFVIVYLLQKCSFHYGNPNQLCNCSWTKHFLNQIRDNVIWSTIYWTLNFANYFFVRFVLLLLLNENKKTLASGRVCQFVFQKMFDIIYFILLYATMRHALSELFPKKKLTTTSFSTIVKPLCLKVLPHQHDLSIC